VKRGGSTLAIGTVRTFNYTGKSKALLEEFGMMVMEEHAFEQARWEAAGTPSEGWVWCAPPREVDTLRNPR
jgi:hypothetical protein